MNNNCIDDLFSFLKRHVGKMSIFLGVSGVVTSVLIGLHLLIPTSVVLSFTNLGVIIGGIAYETIQNEYEKVNTENESLKFQNKRLSEWKWRHTQSLSDNTNTPNNDDTEPDKFDSIYQGLNNNSNNNVSAFPTE